MCGFCLWISTPFPFVLPRIKHLSVWITAVPLKYPSVSVAFLYHSVVISKENHDFLYSHQTGFGVCRTLQLRVPNLDNLCFPVLGKQLPISPGWSDLCEFHKTALVDLKSVLWSPRITLGLVCWVCCVLVLPVCVCHLVLSG